ncbi:MAG: hypothetical protein ACRD0O_04590 [Acidimicrobiia bacterium]
MLTFLLQDEPPENNPAEVGAALPPRRCDWWDFERGPRLGHDPTHPAAIWVTFLIQEAAAMTLACPRCGEERPVHGTLDHLLRHHGAGYDEAAAWLEAADADLFSLAIHYLATKARAGASAAEGEHTEPDTKPGSNPDIPSVKGGFRFGQWSRNRPSPG